MWPRGEIQRVGRWVKAEAGMARASVLFLPPPPRSANIKIIPYAKSLSGDTFFIANCVNLIEARSAKYRTNCAKFTIARFISHRFTIKFSPDTFPNNTFKWELSQTFNAEVYFEIRVIYLKQWKILTLVIWK